MTENISSRMGPIGDDPVQMVSTATKLKTFTIAKGTKAQITQAYSEGLIGATDFAIATDEDLLDNKADKDLSNLSNGLTNTICKTPATTTSTASSVTPAVVVENYVNGANWYRIWSDGWCEQGGFVASTGTDYQEQTVNFLKPMANVDYNVQITMYSNYSNTAVVKGYSYYEPTTINMKVYPQKISLTKGLSWQISGKIGE